MLLRTRTLFVRNVAIATATASATTAIPATQTTTTTDTFAVYKPCHVPLFSPLQALHNTFDATNDTFDSVANRVLRSSLQNEKPKPIQPAVSPNTKCSEEAGDEEIVRVDHKGGGIHAVSELLLSSSSSPSSSSSTTATTTVSSKEVRFPIATSDWFSTGVVLAATSPSAFAFLLHSACMGAVRREYHALCTVPSEIAASIACAHELEQRNEATISSSFSLNPHIVRHNQQLREKKTSGGSGNVNGSENVDSAIIGGSRPIAMSSLLRESDGGVAASGWLRGGMVRLSELAAARNYRPDIDALFFKSSCVGSSANTAGQQQSKQQIQHQQHQQQQAQYNQWSTRRPHPFLRNTDIYAPAKTELVRNLPSGMQVKVQYIVEGIRGNVIHLKMSVLGLQSEAAIRAALAAAGVPVVNDFEYCPTAAAFYASSSSSFSSLSSLSSTRKNDMMDNKKIAVENNRLLTKQELEIKTLMEQDPDQYRVQLVCSRIVYPDPVSHRNIGLLRHMVGTRITGDIVRDALRRVPERDATALFECRVAEMGALPPAFQRMLPSMPFVDLSLPPSGLEPKQQQQQQLQREKDEGKLDVISERERQIVELKPQLEESTESQGGATTASTKTICNYLEDETKKTALAANNEMKEQQQQQAAVVKPTDPERDAREIILSKMRAFAEEDEMVADTNRRRSFIRDSEFSAPPLHRGRRLHRNNNAGGYNSAGDGSRQQTHQKQPRCRYCFGAHPLSRCPKLEVRKGAAAGREQRE